MKKHRRSTLSIQNALGVLRHLPAKGLEKEETMPAYEFECAKCHQHFTVQQSLKQHDEHKKPKCPKCSSRSVQQLITSIHVKTSKKS